MKANTVEGGAFWGVGATVVGFGGQFRLGTDSAIHQTEGDTALYCAAQTLVCNHGKTGELKVAVRIASQCYVCYALRGSVTFPLRCP